MADFSRFTEIVPPLLAWYDKSARELPWRSDPTPYHVLVSEIMLQQTRVEAVRARYEEFVHELPTIEALAACPEDRLLKLWEGLGYYSRARNLQRAAQKILSDYGGEVPRDPKELRTLPGIGEYCAGSVSSIAYGVRAPAVDGNVLRVISRLASYEEDISRPAVKKELTARVERILPRERCGDFNQALMELGALICLPNGAPLCGACPLRELCEGRRLGTAASLPKKTPRAPRRAEEIGVLLLRSGEKFALRKRPARGLLAGMWELPTFSGGVGEFLSAEHLAVGQISPGKQARHVFTHVEWHMTSYEGEAVGEALPQGWVWADQTELAGRYALPSAFSPFLKKDAGGPSGPSDG